LKKGAQDGCGIVREPNGSARAQQAA